ncbi:DUF3408 domain-containing protein [Flavobacterium sp. PL02]|uniref:DUF3408 domain-containing protein n=1 Tax=Flavobacterium sp. PL02 TaxID=3088354 RepID=UPI002B22A00D|nr:DUF3408 domain-containing protein [Flavobacterium sp. PL02]MEA9412625.1 DUF3408 domain-containing protein [Flavobacterium sp. PL02]
MEKENKKKVTPEIDEALMMDIMADGVKKEGLTPPAEKHKPSPEPLQEKPLTKERMKIKKGTYTDYEAIFFKKTHTNARDGKTVYIQPDFHEKLSRIVQVIGEDKLAIYAYLNNVLEYHFQEFGEQITKSFNEKYKPIL